MTDHIITYGEHRDGWKAYCTACSDAVGEYVWPCKLGQGASRPELLVTKADFDRVSAELAEAKTEAERATQMWSNAEGDAITFRERLAEAKRERDASVRGMNAVLEVAKAVERAWVGTGTAESPQPMPVNRIVGPLTDLIHVARRLPVAPSSSDTAPDVDAAVYRVGRHQPRNLYRGDEYMGVMFDPADAAAVVEALNGAAPSGTAAEQDPYAACGICTATHCCICSRDASVCPASPSHPPLPDTAAEPGEEHDSRRLNAYIRTHETSRKRIADLMEWCASDLGNSHIHRKIRELLAIPDGAYPWQTPYMSGDEEPSKAEVSAAISGAVETASQLAAIEERVTADRDVIVAAYELAEKASRVALPPSAMRGCWSKLMTLVFAVNCRKALDGKGPYVVETVSAGDGLSGAEALDRVSDPSGEESTLDEGDRDDTFHLPSLAKVTKTGTTVWEPLRSAEVAVLDAAKALCALANCWPSVLSDTQLVAWRTLRDAVSVLDVPAATPAGETEPGCTCGTVHSGGKFVGVDGDPSCAIHGGEAAEQPLLASDIRRYDHSLCGKDHDHDAHTWGDPKQWCSGNPVSQPAPTRSQNWEKCDGCDDPTTRDCPCGRRYCDDCECDCADWHTVVHEGHEGGYSECQKPECVRLKESPEETDECRHCGGLDGTHTLRVCVTEAKLAQWEAAHCARCQYGSCDGCFYCQQASQQTPTNSQNWEQGDKPLFGVMRLLGMLGADLRGAWYSRRQAELECDRANKHDLSSGRAPYEIYQMSKATTQICRGVDCSEGHTYERGCALASSPPTAAGTAGEAVLS